MQFDNYPIIAIVQNQLSTLSTIVKIINQYLIDNYIHLIAVTLIHYNNNITIPIDISAELSFKKDSIGENHKSYPYYNFKT